MIIMRPRRSDLFRVIRPISTQENKHGIGPDRNKIKPAHGLSVPIFCSSLNLWSSDKELKYFQLFWSGAVDNTRWKKSSPIRSDAYFPEWKPAYTVDSSWKRQNFAWYVILAIEFNACKMRRLKRAWLHELWLPTLKRKHCSSNICSSWVPGTKITIVQAPCCMNFNFQM